MRLARRLAFAGVLLSPGVALACGACTDGMVSRAAWWAHLGLWLIPALMLDAVGARLLARFGLIQSPQRMRGSTKGLLALIAVGMSFVGFGLTIPVSLVAAFGAAQWVRAMRRDVQPRWLRLTRIGVAANLVLALAFFNRPAALSTDYLIRSVLYQMDGHGPSLSHPGWREEELARRPEAAPAIERLYSEAKSIDPHYERRWEFLALHYIAHGDPAFRARECAPLRAEGGPSIESICGPAPR